MYDSRCWKPDLAKLMLMWRDPTSNNLKPTQPLSLFQRQITMRQLRINRRRAGLNIIAYAKRGGFWPRQIMFRDYLRNHPEALEEYQELKLDLLKKDPTGKGEYIIRKSDFVQEILRSAGWREQTYEEWVLENND